MKLSNCTISKISTLADRSIRIVLDTRELSPDEMQELFASYGTEVEKMELDILPEETRSKAERMRNSIFRIWESHHKDKPDSPYKKDSELYYAATMEQLISTLKEKI